MYSYKILLKLGVFLTVLSFLIVFPAFEMQASPPMPAYNMAYLYETADAVVLIDKPLLSSDDKKEWSLGEIFSFGVKDVSKDWVWNSEPKVLEVYKGQIAQDQALPIHMLSFGNSIYNYLSDSWKNPDKTYTKKLEYGTAKALLFLKWNNEEKYYYLHTSNGVRLIVNNLVLIGRPNDNFGRLHYVLHSPEFVELKAGELYGLTQLKKDLSLAIEEASKGVKREESYLQIPNRTLY